LIWTQVIPAGHLTYQARDVKTVTFRNYQDCEAAIQWIKDAKLAGTLLGISVVGDCYQQ